MELRWRETVRKTRAQARAHLSYMERFWSSERTSYALEMRLKVSSAPGSLLTSGWNLRAFCLHRRQSRCQPALHAP